MIFSIDYLWLPSDCHPACLRGASRDEPISGQYYLFAILSCASEPCRATEVLDRDRKGQSTPTQFGLTRSAFYQVVKDVQAATDGCESIYDPPRFFVVGGRPEVATIN
jgi:hypothetical protein